MVKQFHLNDHCDLIGQNCSLSWLKKFWPATCCSLFSALITLQDFTRTDSKARVSIQLNKWSLFSCNDPKLPKSHFQVTGPLRGLLFLMQNTGTSFRGLDMCRKQNVLSVFAVDFQVVSELRANLDFASSTLPPAACSTPAEQRHSNEGYSS